MGKKAIHTSQELEYLQALPLDLKVCLTKQRLREFIRYFGEDGVYLSFSGGKDSTVLLDIIKQEYDIPIVYCDTGLEFPELREFVKNTNNVTWIRPEKNFKQVIDLYGYPICSKDVAQSIYDIRIQAKRSGVPYKQTNLFKRNFVPTSDYCLKYPMFCKERYSFLLDSPFLISHMCCNIMKKQPFKKYKKETGRKMILATMACESRIRKTSWLKDGCNAFDQKRASSKPMSFWKNEDVLQYIKKNNIKIPSVYGDIIQDKTGKLITTGMKRTGCMFCMFGCFSKGWNNLELIKNSHGHIYEYIMKPMSAGGLGYKEIVDWLNENGNLDIKY